MTTRESLRRQFYEMLMESQFWSLERLVAYQREQLIPLLRQAKAHVPFYKTRLDAVLPSNGEVRWDRWGEIPIVKRQDMIDSREEMQTLELPPGHGPVSTISTSGSTGLPITVSVSAIGGIAQAGLRWRVQRWQDLDWSKTLCSRLGGVQHAADWPEGEPMGFWGPPWDLDAKRGGSWKVSRSWSSPELFAFFREHRCSYLNAGPNMAHINALDARRLGESLRIDAILAQGNVVTQADRDICLEVFGARLIEHYSSKEGGQMAHPCPNGRLHINMEGCLIEILDADGRPCTEGETGRVIVTPLLQTAQPLIRYEQGDWATVGGACSCGRHSPSLSEIVGRNIAIFRHPDGRLLANRMPDETRDVLAAQYFQLAQVGPNDYELRYVPDDWSASGDEGRARALFAARYFADASLRFVRQRDIALSSGGKLVEYVNEWAMKG
jgi:phenylacetate-CoA ligase